MISLVCVCCGKQYQKRQRGSKYCSRTCYNLARTVKVERTCACCGNSFLAYRYLALKGWAKYCSKECACGGSDCHDINEAWLRVEYVNNGRSLGDIAKELNVTPGAVHYQLRKYGIACRVSKFDSAKYTFETVDKEWLLSEYLERNRPCNLIAADLGVNYTSVRRWLINMGVRIRPETSYHVGEPRSDEVKKKISAVVLSMKIRGPKCGMWKGGISFGEYCPKFNNRLKEEIREAFGRRCFICGAPENGYKLHVHHCDYNKGQGCGKRWNLVPLCRSCHMKTNSNRHYHFNLLANHWAKNPEILI